MPDEIGEKRYVPDAINGPVLNANNGPHLHRKLLYSMDWLK